MTTSIAPLRKINREGKLYHRPDEIMAKLEELILLPRNEIAERGGGLEADDAKYIPSECVVYLLREYRSRPIDDCAEVLYKTLLKRFLKGVSKPGYELAATESLVESNIRDEAVSRFLELLMKDRNGDYQTKLDFFEIRFNQCVEGIRNDAKRKIYADANIHKPMEFEEDGEPSVEVERAVRGYTPFGPAKIGEQDYGARLDQAIDVLPPIHKAVVVMLRRGMNIESKEPGATTISGVLKKTPKTIAKYRDLAFAALKKTLKGETT